MSGPEPGEWVQVWGQVVEEPAHPEDLAVEMFSHSDQYVALVRRDRVISVPNPPDFVRICTHLHQSSIDDSLRRCVLHERHGKRHEDSNGTRWPSGTSAGFMEDA